MKIVLLRHGQRSSGYGDVELSSEGHQQAHSLCSQNNLNDINTILCSPKIRTRQTIQPLADKLALKVHIENDLDQRKSIETEQEFISRVLNFMQFCTHKYQGKNLLLCSHSDWLQIAVLHLFSENPKAASLSFFNCADYRTLSFENSLWSIS